MRWLPELLAWFLGGSCRRCGGPADLCSTCAEATAPAVPVEGARVCVDCELIFAPALTCPRCGSRTSWIQLHGLGRGDSLDRRRTRDLARRVRLARQTTEGLGERRTVLTWMGGR